MRRDLKFRLHLEKTIMAVKTNTAEKYNVTINSNLCIADHQPTSPALSQIRINIGKNPSIENRITLITILQIALIFEVIFDQILFDFLSD